MIESIKYTNDIPTVAQVNTITRQLTINPAMWKPLPDSFKKFVLLHEHAHIELNTTDEIQCDNFAFEHLKMDDPEGFRDNVRIISTMLPFTTPGHWKRILNAYTKALDPYKNDSVIKKEIEKLNFSGDPLMKKKPVYNRDRNYTYDYNQEAVESFTASLYDDRASKPWLSDEQYTALLKKAAKMESDKYLTGEIKDIAIKEAKAKEAQEEKTKKIIGITIIIAVILVLITIFKK